MKEHFFEVREQIANALKHCEAAKASRQRNGDLKRDIDVKLVAGPLRMRGLSAPISAYGTAA